MTTSATGPAAVTVRGLRKSHPSRRGVTSVLDGVDLDVAAGTVLALLGPNGAGKTTTVHILSTLVRPDAGTVVVAGHDLATDPGGVRAAIGLTGQFASVDALLTGEENLRLMADLRHLGARAGRRVPAARPSSTSPTSCPDCSSWPSPAPRPGRPSASRRT